MLDPTIITAIAMIEVIAEGMDEEATHIIDLPINPNHPLLINTRITPTGDVVAIDGRILRVMMEDLVEAAHHHHPLVLILLMTTTEATEGAGTAWVVDMVDMKRLGIGQLQEGTTGIMSEEATAAQIVMEATVVTTEDPEEVMETMTRHLETTVVMVEEDMMLALRRHHHHHPTRGTEGTEQALILLKEGEDAVGINISG